MNDKEKNRLKHELYLLFRSKVKPWNYEGLEEAIDEMLAIIEKTKADNPDHGALGNTSSPKCINGPSCPNLCDDNTQYAWCFRK